MVVIFGSLVLAQGADPAAPASPAVNPATETKSGTETKAAKDQIDAAINAFQQKNLDFMKRLRAQKDRKRQMEMYRNERPTPAEELDLVLKLAQEDPTAEGIEKGLTWSLQGANATQRKEISRLLLTHYKVSASIGKLAQSYARTRGGGEDELRQIAQLAGDETVRQMTGYYFSFKLGACRS